MKWNNIDTCKSFYRLKDSKKISLKEVLKPNFAEKRIKNYECKISNTLKYNYATKQVNEEIIEIFQNLAYEQELIKKYQALLLGEIINISENRKVQHHFTRNLSAINKDNFYLAELEKIKSFVEQIHNKKILSSSNKPFTNVVQIGIGGSDLGPKSLYIALKEYAKTTNNIKMIAHFISNIDPEDAVSSLSKIPEENTLFIIASKSGTTQETLANERLIIKYLHLKGIKEPKKNIVVVTSNSSPLAKDNSYLSHFYMDDFIGGRYSSTSVCGGLVLSLAFGNNTFQNLLQGAEEADKNALNENIKENATLMDALICVYERSILGYHATAILPYAKALSHFVAHLQQLDMESSGKSVNINSKPISYNTGSIVFGEPGTNGQHSFYQFLHQSNEIIPMQFIAFKESSLSYGLPKNSNILETDYINTIKEHHQYLLANLIAQIYAFAIGKEDKNKNKHFEGERPSSLIYGEKLDAHSLGALLAHFENKVMFQGFLWNINSFDQEGAQLGKQIKIEDSNEILKTYSMLLFNK